MIRPRLAKLVGTHWTGTGELWLDPEGNSVDQYDCELHIETDAVHYSWSYENEIKKGGFIFNEKGAVWSDSWHQPKSVACLNVPDSWGLFAVKNIYDVPYSPSWGWRSKLSERPDGTLVLQMTNITPWGEEGRAVRMVFTSKN